MGRCRRRTPTGQRNSSDSRERTLKRAKKKVEVDTYREGFGAAGTWYWRLPIGGQPPPKNDIGGQPQNVAPFDLLCNRVAPYRR